jgi:hypothetical protein
MAEIKGKTVEPGTILFRRGNRMIHFARVERLTKTQAVCQHLTDGLEPYEHPRELRIKLDYEDKWGVRPSGLEIGTGGGWHSNWWRVPDDLDELVEELVQEKARRKQVAQDKAAREKARIAGQFQAISEGYERRITVDLTLGVQSMSFDHPKVGRVAVAWTTEPREEYDWDTREHYDAVYLDVAFWYTKHDRTTRSTTTVTARTELEALAALRYD